VDRSMHVAIACGVPLVAIVSPTNHLQTSPVSKHARIVRHRFECSPCMKERTDRIIGVCYQLSQKKSVPSWKA
jgi:ADP-heptose:LPS heptosyltransferase